MVSKWQSQVLSLGLCVSICSGSLHMTTFPEVCTSTWRFSYCLSTVPSEVRFSTAVSTWRTCDRAVSGMVF